MGIKIGSEPADYYGQVGSNLTPHSPDEIGVAESRVVIQT